ncbi:MAG: hypothetical protein JNM27_20575 [Leptospirales bacterium]|nr:hypothetical protein [Leptospirales bacterium]
MTRNTLSRASLLALLVSLLLLATSCASGQERQHPNFTSAELREFGIAVFFPALWDLNFDSRRKLHLIIRGTTPDGLRASMEYRGIAQTQEDVDLYAQGWQKAMPANFDGFEIVDKQKLSSESGDVYHFEATFREGETLKRVIGRLRFREGRVHAMYYIAADKDFASFRPVVEEMDQLHRYFKP